MIERQTLSNSTTEEDKFFAALLRARTFSCYINLEEFCIGDHTDNPWRQVKAEAEKLGRVDAIDTRQRFDQETATPCLVIFFLSCVESTSGGAVPSSVSFEVLPFSIEVNLTDTDLAFVSRFTAQGWLVAC